MLEQNIKAADEFFKKLMSSLSNINYHTKDLYGKEYKIRFTYYSGMKNWSHQATIVANDQGVNFISQRMMKIPGMDKFQRYDFNGSEVDYEIPINDKFLVLKFLVEHDRFKMKNGF